MARWHGRSLAVTALVLAPALVRSQPAASQRQHAHGEDVYLAGPSVDVTQEVRGDLVAAGGTVHVARPVAESAIVAGGDVVIDGSVGDDVIAAGGNVVLGGTAGDDARLAGGTVRILGRVEDDVSAAGGTVRIEQGAVVGGRAWLFGGDVAVAGTVGGALRAAGGRVSIDGTVRGDVQVESDSLEIGPAAQIEGAVIHRGRGEPRIDPQAHIAGRVEHHRPAAPPPARAFGFLWLLLAVPALLVTGAVLIALFPRFTSAAAQTIATDAWRSLGVGALALVGAPALTVALFVTGVGIPLGLLLLAGYLAALLLGYLVSAVFLGRVGMTRLGERGRERSKGALVVGLLVALLVLGLLRLVPILGGLVSLAALLFGTGGFLIQLYRTYRGGGAARPAAPG
jgi:hypothetical protein